MLDDDKGSDKTMGADGGLAGALLLDLAAGGWLDDVEGKLVPASDSPAGPPPAGALADALAVIAADGKPRDAKHWVRKLPDELKPIKGRVAERLVEAGVLSDQRRKVLGLVPVERYPEADPVPERALRERLRAELTGGDGVSERTAMLVSLLRAYDLISKIVAKDERRVANRRAKEIAEDPGKVGAAVRSVLSETQMAISAAIVAGTFAAEAATSPPPRLGASDPRSCRLVVARTTRKRRNTASAAHGADAVSTTGRHNDPQTPQRPSARRDRSRVSAKV